MSDNRFLNMSASHVWTYLAQHEHSVPGSEEFGMCLMLRECIAEIERQSSVIQSLKARIFLIEGAK